MAEEPTTPPNLKQHEPEQTASSVGSNNPKAGLQLSTDDASTITTITSKLGGFDLSSYDVTSDEEPTTPPPSFSLSKQGPELRSATKDFSYSTDVSFMKPDVSEDYEEIDETISSSSLFTSLGIDTERVVHKGKDHHRMKDFAKAPKVNEEIDEAKVRQLKKDKGVKGDNDIVKSLEKYKNEYLRTKRTYDNLDDLKKDKIGYGDLWQVRCMGKDEVLQKIDEIYENLLRGQKENGEGKCFTLDTEQAIVCVEELQCKVLKGKSTYRCNYDKKPEIFARIDLLLHLIYRLLKADMTINIRKIHYTYKEMFANTSAVQNVLERICKAIGCSRDSLNIFASAKGRIAGDIKFTFTKEGRRYVTNCQYGTGIEPRDVAHKLEFVKLTTTKLLLILVVEKDTIFQRLLEEKFHKRFRCIIITGCGMPTVATRTLLNKAQKELDLPVVFLGDQNTGGFNICSSYFCGSKDMAYDSLNLCTPSIEWLGLSPSDLEKHGIPAGKEKVRGLEELKKKLDFVTPELAEQVAKMETKVDVEVMSKIYLKYLTEIYLPLKFQELGSAKNR